MIVLTPPALPPTILKSAHGGEGDWSLVTLDLATAKTLLSTFYQSYDEAPDFSIFPLKMTETPQGLLGVARKGDVRLVCHYLEKEPGVASITTIAVPQNEFDAGEKFLEYMDNLDFLTIDQTAIQAQPKWAMAINFRQNIEK